MSIVVALSGNDRIKCFKNIFVSIPDIVQYLVDLI